MIYYYEGKINCS